jgi:two-component system, NtrC family, response regulator HydG
MKSELPAILVVDDDVDACKNLADILNDIGYRADTAYDGPSALELIRRQNYRIAVLDFRMPGMDGMTLCREIRAVSAGTVAIIVTAYTGQASPALFLQAGASLVLPKPIDVPMLLDTLAKVSDG